MAYFNSTVEAYDLKHMYNFSDIRCDKTEDEDFDNNNLMKFIKNNKNLKFVRQLFIKSKYYKKFSNDNKKFYTIFLPSDIFINDLENKIKNLTIDDSIEILNSNIIVNNKLLKEDLYNFCKESYYLINNQRIYITKSLKKNKEEIHISKSNKITDFDVYNSDNIAIHLTNKIQKCILYD